MAIGIGRGTMTALGCCTLLVTPGTGASAQVGTPQAPIDADLAPSSAAAPQNAAPVAQSAPVQSAPVQSTPAQSAPVQSTQAQSTQAQYGQTQYGQAQNGQASPRAPGGTTGYQEDDLVGAAEGVFGKGARGLALAIRDVLKKQGQPIGYITGREAGGAFFVGLRYGSGTLHHKIEGERPVYWTGPSLGFDWGGDAGKTFVLVYNVEDTEQMFTRFAAGEGQAYFVGGFHISYMRHGDMVLIPVRMGVGLRLGVNGGYMKFTRKQNWIPL